MGMLLLLGTIHEFLRPVQSVNGVIWDRKSGDFVPIFDVPVYAALKQKVVSESRELETHNFQGNVIRLSFYEEMNIMTSEANGTRVSGVIGEIWNTLAEFLNFTLEPVLSKEHTVGYATRDGRYNAGLLKYIQRNECDVVHRLEAHSKRLEIVQLTNPLWRTSYRLYIRGETSHVSTWMIKLFSRKVWISILITYIVLSLCSYLSQKIGYTYVERNAAISLSDHYLYNFGMLCDQGYLPPALTRSSRMVEFVSGIFSCLIRTAFGALLVRYMTQTTVMPPINDFKSLAEHSSYNVLTLRGSLPNIMFEVAKIPPLENIARNKRYFVAETIEELYSKTCNLNNRFLLFYNEDSKKVRGVYVCPLKPAGNRLFQSWIDSGVSWNFKYKRTIDIGLLRLYENGVIKLLRHRWIEAKNVEPDKYNTVEPIVLDQMYFLIIIMTFGWLMSLAIILLENMAFECKNC